MLLPKTFYPRQALVEQYDSTNLKLVFLVNRFRSLQDPTGSIFTNINLAQSLLEEIKPIVRAICYQLNLTNFSEAFEADVQQWQTQGLNTTPDFSQSQVAYTPPNDGSITFFIGVFIATNGSDPKGYFLDCFFAQREEPQECQEVYRQFPHPKNSCQSCCLLLGSLGISTGNCIVFFPENILTKKKVIAQNFALFFFNKFQPIYLSQTLPRVQHLFGKNDWISGQLSPTECYIARCIWGYLHDYFHHCGSRPLDTNLQVKLNWFAGLLEEIKVDCQTAITAYTENIPFGREIFEFILFERMFRYPSQPDATTNFDAGSGMFLFEWLFQHKTITTNAIGHLQIDLEVCLVTMQDLIDQIESLEKEVDNHNYLCKAKYFIRTLLPAGELGQRFSIPETFSGIIKILPQ